MGYTKNNQETVRLEDILIRTELHPGDIGYIIYLHGLIYGREYGFGVQFESYVAYGLCELWEQFEPDRDRIWLCEHEGMIIGCLALMHRGPETAQLRYFLLERTYRGLGLGKKLMDLLMAHVKNVGFRHVYLWTTGEQDKAARLYKALGFRLVEEKYSDAFGKGLYEQKYELRVG